MVGGTGETEVVVLLGSFKVARPAEEFRLLVIGGAEVVEAVRVTR
jgi:ribosomal protein S7